MSKTTPKASAEPTPVEPQQPAADQQPAPAAIEPQQPPLVPSDDPLQATATVEFVFGRALVDIPAIPAKCGEYGTLPAAPAAELERAGQFDPRARPSED